MDISREEFITTLNEKDKYEKTKDNLRSVKNTCLMILVAKQRMKL